MFDDAFEGAYINEHDDWATIVKEISNNNDIQEYDWKSLAEQQYLEGEYMPGYLIKDTTKEEREQIVTESLGNISASCDGCSAGIIEIISILICDILLLQ